MHHAVVRISDSVLEMGEAHDKYATMEAMFYLYVPNMHGADWPKIRQVARVRPRRINIRP